MNKKFLLINEEVALAAVEEGKKLGFNPECNKTENGYEITASYPEKKEDDEKYVSYDSMQYFREYVGYEIKYLREDLGYLWKAIHEHKKGHLPPIADAGKMESALAALGLADSYNVQKPTVWVEY